MKNVIKICAICFGLALVMYALYVLVGLAGERRATELAIGTLGSLAGAFGMGTATYGAAEMAEGIKKLKTLKKALSILGIALLVCIAIAFFGVMMAGLYLFTASLLPFLPQGWLLG